MCPYLPLPPIVAFNTSTQVRWHTILIRALDLITVVVPPALPATLSIGTSFALNRLRRSGIFCISPNRINVAGKINVCCFDKTGTLTEDGLDILGVRALDRRNDNRFGELIDNVYDLPGPVGREKATFLYALATCHQLKVVDEEVIGDPLDVKMFQFTKWLIEEGNVAGTGLIRDRGSREREVRPAALVQTIVRPPGSAQFRIEDALKGATKVGLPSPQNVSRLLNFKAYLAIWLFHSMLTSSSLVLFALSNSSRSFVG
jgi:cation-transporting ATPase 13A2